MSLYPEWSPVDGVGAQVFIRQQGQPVLHTGGEPFLFADADGNLVWVAPNQSKNGYVPITEATYAIVPTDRKVAVNRAGAVVISLLESFPEGVFLTIWDADANAGVVGQEITITPPANQQINSLGNGTAYVLKTQNGRASLIRSGDRWNLV